MVLALRAVPSPLRLDEHQVARVGQTRVTLDSVIADFKVGSSAEAIVAHYPALSSTLAVGRVSRGIAERIGQARHEGAGDYDDIGVRSRHAKSQVAP